MSDQPEPLAAILAEMRAARNAASDMTLVPTEWLTQWSDRIEAAAERDRENADLRAIHRCHDCERENATLGNAAAMREALEKFFDLARRGLAFFTSYRYTEAENNELEDAFANAKSTIAAPARNCDICRTKREAKMEYDSRHDAEYGSKDDFVDWLFRPAEGGAE